MRVTLYKLPQEFLNKLKKIYPHKYPQILNTFLAKRISSFRINYLKTDLPTLRRCLLRARIRFKELPFPKGAFLLYSDLRCLQRTEIYQEGLVYVQNTSSMIPVVVLDPGNEDKILDLCAAPGAKTTQIASFAPGAEVIAIEKIRTRYYKLLSNLKIQGAEGVETYLYDGIRIRKKFPEHFDKILLDVPCSAEGRFFLNNPRSFKYWKERKVKEMVSKQKKLLHAAFFALKEEGTLVYSTCTFSPEENEGVINWYINKFKEKIEVLPVEIPLSNTQNGMVCWKNEKFSTALKLTKRIIPNDYMEGFFIAKLKKISV